MATKLNKKQQVALQKRQLYRKIIGIMAIIGVVSFLLYRFTLLDTFITHNPLKTIGQIQKESKDFRDYVCSAQADDMLGKGAELSYVPPAPHVLERYKTNLEATNLVTNASLSSTREGGDPVGFSRSTVVDEVHSYSLNKDEANEPFLRSERKVANASTATWVMDPVALKQTDYYFSVELRSQKPISISLLLTRHDGSQQYRSYTQINGKSSWQKVDGYFQNIEHQYKSVQILAHSTKTGTTDLRKPIVQALKQNPLNNGIVSITFDDGWESIYKFARPLFEKYDVVTTQFVIGSYTAKETGGYMTVAQLKNLQAAGHEIASHSLKHCDQTKLAATDLAYDASETKDVLTSNGLGSAGYAYPYGAYDVETFNELQKLHRYTRTSDEGFNDYYVNPYQIRTQNVTNQTTQAEIDGWLATAKQYNYWLVLVYHRVDESGEYSITVDQLNKHLASIQGSGLTVMTVDQALKAVNR